MKIQKGDLFRVKSTGEILEITGKWGDNEYRQKHYGRLGRPSRLWREWTTQHGVQHRKNGLPMVDWKRLNLCPQNALIRTYNYGNYYGKRFIVDNIEVDNAI